jgi:hypothetical protein
MTPGPVQGRIQVSAAPEAGLRPGSTVVLRVIKSLDSADAGLVRKWAVAVAGRVYPATTDLALEPGAVFRAAVSVAHGKVVLSLSDMLPEAAPDAVRSTLQSLGLPAGGDAEVIARALAHSGLPLLAETIQKVRALLARSGIEPRTGARAAASLVDRRFDLGGEAARALLPVLAFGQKGGEDPRRYRGRDLPTTREAVKGLVSSLAADPGSRVTALQAYNHTRAASQSWVVIPFVFDDGAVQESGGAGKGGPQGAGGPESAGGPEETGEPQSPGVPNTGRIVGTIKILYDPFRDRAVAFSLVTADISFHLPLQGKTRSLSVYCSARVRPAVERSLDSLRSKFHNMGLEVDDTINEADDFDGYSPGEEGTGFSRVDTVG